MAEKHNSADRQDPGRTLVTERPAKPARAAVAAAADLADTKARLTDVELRLADMAGAAEALMLIAGYAEIEPSATGGPGFPMAVEWIGAALRREIDAAMDVACGDMEPRRAPSPAQECAA